MGQESTVARNYRASSPSGYRTVLRVAVWAFWLNGSARYNGLGVRVLQLEIGWRAVGRRGLDLRLWQWEGPRYEKPLILDGVIEDVRHLSSAPREMSFLTPGVPVAKLTDEERQGLLNQVRAAYAGVGQQEMALPPQQQQAPWYELQVTPPPLQLVLPEAEAPAPTGSRYQEPFRLYPPPANPDCVIKALKAARPRLSSDEAWRFAKEYGEGDGAHEE